MKNNKPKARAKRKSGWKERANHALASAWRILTRVGKTTTLVDGKRRTIGSIGGCVVVQTVPKKRNTRRGELEVFDNRGRRVLAVIFTGEGKHRTRTFVDDSWVNWIAKLAQEVDCPQPERAPAPPPKAVPVVHLPPQPTWPRGGSLR